VSRAPLAILTLLLAFAGACGGDEDVTVDWDLRRSHTIDDVRWPEDQRDLSAAQVEPEGDVRIRLRAGTFAAPGGAIARINLGRGDARSRDVDEVLLTSTPRTTDEAATLAREWARQWNLPTEPIDDWARKAARDPKATAFTGSGLRGKPGEALPEVELRYSFDDERPTVVGMQFLWVRSG
jgi:hypothetical protein